MIKAILFDMDGLMFDTETLATEAFIYSGKQNSVDITPEETHKVLGFTKEKIYNFFEEYFNGMADGRKIVSDHYKYMDKILFTEGPKKMYYVEELLQYLVDKNYKIAVASSSDLNIIKNNLEKTNLVKYIDVVASGEEVKNGKPAPDIFLLAASRLEVLPKECIVLEDSKSGILAAKAAGMKPIMIPDIYNPEKEFKKIPYKIIDNLSEVIPILENLT